MKCNLRQIKQEQGWTQKWLSEKVGVSNRTMSEIINEKREPTLRIAIKIAKVVGVSVEELWELE